MLGYQDLNLGMLESKSSVLPLDDTPKPNPYKLHFGIDVKVYVSIFQLNFLS